MIDTPLPRTVAVIEQGMAQNLHIGAQLYVSVAGRPVADLAFGQSRPGVPMTTDTILLWLSAGKPITALAIAQLWEEGRLELDDRVVEYIPEFAANGKEAVTIRHILTHTAGLRLVASNWSRAPWEQIIARICAAGLEEGWVPGRKAGYNAGTSWFILGEIVQRIDGRPLDQYVRHQIFQPLGLADSWLAIPPEIFRAYGDRIGILQDTIRMPPKSHLNWDTEESAAVCRPGANTRGPIHDLGRFYEMLLNRGLAPAHAGSPHPRQIITSQTVEALTARHRTGMFDVTFNHVMDWTLGFLPNSSIYGTDSVPYGYGPYASPRTFGHGGSQCSGGYADPERGLVVAYIFNGTPGEPRHQERVRALNTAIYEDLGIAGK